LKFCCNRNRIKLQNYYDRAGHNDKEDPCLNENNNEIITQFEMLQLCEHNEAKDVRRFKHAELEFDQMGRKKLSFVDISRIQ
jgi:hypothetical protein